VAYSHYHSNRTFRINPIYFATSHHVWERGTKLKTAEAIARALCLEKRLRDDEAEASAVFDVFIKAGVGKKHCQIFFAATEPRCLAGEREKTVVFPQLQSFSPVGIGEALPIDPRRIADNEIKRFFTDEHRRELVFKKACPDAVFLNCIQLGNFLKDGCEGFNGVVIQAIQICAELFYELLIGSLKLDRFLKERAYQFNFLFFNYGSGKAECSFGCINFALTIARRFNAGMLAHGHQSHRDG